MPSFIAGLAACVLLTGLALMVLDAVEISNIEAYDLPSVHVGNGS